VCWSITRRAQQILDAGWGLWLSRGYGLPYTALPIVVRNAQEPGCADAWNIVARCWYGSAITQLLQWITDSGLSVTDCEITLVEAYPAREGQGLFALRCHCMSICLFKLGIPPSAGAVGISLRLAELPCGQPGRSRFMLTRHRCACPAPWAPR